MRRRSFARSLQGYAWAHYALCTGPLAAMLAAVALFVGTGLRLAEKFTVIRAIHPDITDWMQIVTDWSNPAFYAVYLAIFLYGLRRRDMRLVRLTVCYVLVQLAVSFLLVHVLKISVGKPRPGPLIMGTGYDFMTFSPANHSFPSGHTTEIVGALTPLATRFARVSLSLCLGCIVALVGFSRLYLGMHHLSDVAAGLVLGSIAGFLIHHYSQEAP